MVDWWVSGASFTTYGWIQGKEGDEITIDYPSYFKGSSLFRADN